jgi:hypothetical protein
MNVRVRQLPPTLNLDDSRPGCAWNGKIAAAWLRCEKADETCSVLETFPRDATT